MWSLLPRSRWTAHLTPPHSTPSQRKEGRNAWYNSFIHTGGICSCTRLIKCQAYTIPVCFPRHITTTRSNAKQTSTQISTIARTSSSLPAWKTSVDMNFECSRKSHDTTRARAAHHRRFTSKTYLHTLQFFLKMVRIELVFICCNIYYFMRRADGSTFFVKLRCLRGKYPFIFLRSK